MAVKKMGKITLPKGIMQSIAERSMVSAAISRLNQGTKYIKYWLKIAKADPNESNMFCLLGAERWANNFLTDFREVEYLAKLYSDLWLEKYYKAKLDYEKAIAKIDALQESISNK